ncbi:MAG TPA: helix-turn-helix domain-containing protein [Steroidobacteraceae bacterium]|nr:helix-turn-helix domain-containing protein [Steroidobacteraceae bacterium]
MESFSTYSVPVSRKVSFWNELSSETFAAMEIAPHDSRAFDGELTRAALGSLTLMDVQSAAVRIRRTRSHIARATQSSLLLLAPLRRSMQLSIENGPATTVRDGELCLLDHGRPYEVVHGDDTRTLCVDIPKRLFENEAMDCDRFTGRLLRADSCNARVLISLLRAIGLEFHPRSTTVFNPATAAGLWNLILAAYEPAVDCTSAREARVRIVRAEIDARLSDPGLKPADVATRCGFSERYLRTVLRGTGESFSAYLLRRRLEHCARLLRDPAWDLRSITEIAFRSGFSDATHFGRAFKARYGRTPRDFRRAAADDPR